MRCLDWEQVVRTITYGFDEIIVGGSKIYGYILITGKSFGIQKIGLICTMLIEIARIPYKR